MEYQQLGGHFSPSKTGVSSTHKAKSYNYVRTKVAKIEKFTYTCFSWNILLKPLLAPTKHTFLRPFLLESLTNARKAWNQAKK